MVGRLTAISVAVVFGVAFVTTLLSFPAWIWALYATLFAFGLTLILAWGWVSRIKLDAGGKTLFALSASCLGISMIVASYLVVGGPGRLPPIETQTVDFLAWAVSAFGLAGALACLGFGVYSVLKGKEATRAAGLGLVAVGLLTPQAAMREFGLPALAPVGILVTLAVIAVGAIVQLWISSPRREP